MRPLAVSLVVAFALASLLIAGCAPAAPPSAPTAAPAAPTKAPEPPKPTAAPAAPTAAPAAPTRAPEPAKPTAAPAPKATYPEKGKAITIINPFAAGGEIDIASRLLAAVMEKELGTSVQVVNKPGAGSQLGATELAAAKPDGYTLGLVTLPTLNTLYLNPDRKTTFNRGSFEPIAGYLVNVGVVAVKADSPYKTMKDLVDAAKANPEKIKASTTGVLGIPHLAILETQRVSGAKFAIVHFDGGAPAATALLGGHTDVAFGFNAHLLQFVTSSQARVLAIMDREGRSYLPGVQTAQAQGYNLVFHVAPTLMGPAGIPRDAVDILSRIVKKATEDPDHQKKARDAGFEVRYMDPAQFATYWGNADVQMKPLMEEALKEATK